MSPKNFSGLLTEIMRRNGITQRALASLAGMDTATLCRILKPDYPHTPQRTIKKLVEHVGCTAAERVELYRLARILPPEYMDAFLQGRLKIIPANKRS